MRLNQLCLFLDDKGIVRCEGRIEHSVVSSQAKTPILLPAKHHVTGLIIEGNHKSSKSFWHKRNTELHSRKILDTATPKLPHLPSWRTSDDPPFSYTGLDFAGRKESKYNQRSIRKSYIALFTCASTRAIHLEQLPSLSTEGFLQAFRRFSSRRGLPRILISDNAKTLIQSG